MDSKEHAWKIEKRIILKGWQFHGSMPGTFDQAIAEAKAILDSAPEIVMVRFAKLGHNIESGHYIPQWDEDIEVPDLTSWSALQEMFGD